MWRQAPAERETERPLYQPWNVLRFDSFTSPSLRLPSDAPQVDVLF